MKGRNSSLSLDIRSSAIFLLVSSHRHYLDVLDGQLGADDRSRRPARALLSRDFNAETYFAQTSHMRILLSFRR